MSFALNKKIGGTKVYIERKANVTRRWDPFYSRPDLVSLEKRASKVASLRLRSFVHSMAGGATPATSESEKHYTEDDDGVPFIRVQNLSTTGVLDLADCKRITRSTHETLLKRSKLTGGELLVKITGVGRMAVASVVPEEFEGNINQHIVAIRTNDIKVSETLAAYLNLDVAERLASRRSTGGTRPALDYPALLSMPVVFDKRIPALMRVAIAKYREKIDEANALQATIDDLLLHELGITPVPDEPSMLESRIFRTSFSHLTGQRIDPLFYQADIFNFARPTKYEFVPLGELVVYFITGFAAGRGDQVDGESGGVVQLRPTNLSDEREFVFRRNVYIAASKLNEKKADVLKKGEVLFNNTNSQEQVGKTVWFNLEGSYFSSNHITRIGTKSSRLDAHFLTYVLNLYQRRQVFFKLCTNWNNQSGVGSDVLRQVPIPLPTVKRQAKIVEALERVRDESRLLKEQADRDLERAKRDIEAMIFGPEPWA